MPTKELVIAGVTLTENGFFEQTKDALKGDVLSFLATQGFMELPIEPNVGLKKTARAEDEYLREHLHATLDNLPELDQDKVEDEHYFVASTLKEIAVEAKDRKDLPEDFVDKVATHILLELATPDAIEKYDLQALADKSGLSANKYQELEDLRTREKKISYADWTKKYKPTVKRLISVAGNASGAYEDDVLKMIVNNVDVLSKNLSKKAKVEILALRDEVLVTSIRRVGTRTIEACTKSEGKDDLTTEEKMIQLESYMSLLISGRNLFENSSDHVQMIKGMVADAVVELGQTEDGLFATMLLAGWREGWVPADKQFLSNSKHFNIEDIGEKNGHTYVYDLVKHVDRKVFDEVGSDLLEAGESTALTVLLGNHKRNGSVVAKWPIWALSRIADCYVEAGFANKSRGEKYKMKKRHGVLPKTLGFDSLRSVIMAVDFLSEVSHEKLSLEGGIPAMKEHYARNQTRIKVPEVLVSAENAKVLYLTDLRIGHKNLDIEFLDKAIDEIGKWKKKDRPSVVVLSDLVQGNFLSLQTGRKDTLVEGYADISIQYRKAKDIIDKLNALGIHVVVIQGDDAVRIAQDYTLKVLKEMGEMAKSLGADTSFSSFAEIYKIQQTPPYQAHNRFQFDIVGPYCLRSGRGLLNAAEVFGKSHGKIEISEYLMLFDVYTSIIKGEVPNAEYVAQLNMENIPLPGKEYDNLDIVDDAAMTIHTPNVDYTHRIFNRFTFSAEPRYSEFTTALTAWIGQMAAQGIQPADLTIAANQGMAAWVAVEDGTKWGAFGPTLHRSNAHEVGRILRAKGDPSWRSLATRKFGFQPATTQFELTEDKMLKVEIMTPTLLAKSMASHERRAIVLLQDWQQGSTTAKPVFQAKQLDYVMRNIARRYKVQMFANGDWIQGRNYHEFANESVGQGQVRIDQQADFNKAMLHASFDHRTAAELAQIESFDVTVGNHEWNSMHKFTGATHSRYIDETMRAIMQAHDPKGTRGLADRVQFHQAMMTRQGDYLVGTWSAPKQVDEFGILIQHLILDKMAKGPGGPSIFQMIPFITGLGGLFDRTDIFGFGHWHYGQGAVIGEKVGVVGPAWAGLSPYEFKLGYRPKPGFVTIYYGGGEPVSVEYGSMATLANHEIKDGPYSQQSLADHGFFDDEGHNPMIHPYAARMAVPQSAIAKKLWSEVDKLNYKADSTL